MHTRIDAAATIQSSQHSAPHNNTFIHDLIDQGISFDNEILLRAYQGTLEVDEQFVNARDNAGNTAIHYAVAGGNQEIVEKLIAKKENENEVNDRHQTALHFAIIYGQVEIARYLIENKYKLAQPDIERNTPFIIAAKYGHVEIMACLLKHTQPLTRDELESRAKEIEYEICQETPLDEAYHQMLLDEYEGIHIQIRNNTSHSQSDTRLIHEYGYTLDVAVENNRLAVVSWMLSNLIISLRGISAALMTAITEDYFDIFETIMQTENSMRYFSSNHENTIALIETIFNYRRTQFIRWVVANKNKFAKDQQRFVNDYLNNLDFLESCCAQHDFELLTFLIDDCRIDLSKQDKYGMTILHKVDDAEVIEFLITKGAPIFVKNSYKQTPLSHAISLSLNPSVNTDNTLEESDHNKIQVLLESGAAIGINLSRAHFNYLKKFNLLNNIIIFNTTVNGKSLHYQGAIRNFKEFNNAFLKKIKFNVHALRYAIAAKIKENPALNQTQIFLNMLCDNMKIYQCDALSAYHKIISTVPSRNLAASPVTDGFPKANTLPIAEETMDDYDIRKKTLLFGLSSVGKNDLILSLIESNADIHIIAQTKLGDETAVLRAARRGQLETVKLLSETFNASLTIRSKWGRNALMNALIFGHNLIVDYLLEQKRQKVEFDDEVFYLAYKGQLNIENISFENIFNVKDQCGFSILDYAIFGRQPALILAKKIIDRIKKEEMIDRINIIQQAIFTAIKCNNFAFLQYLIGNEYDLILNLEETSAIQAAALNNCIDIVKWLAQIDQKRLSLFDKKEIELNQRKRLKLTSDENLDQLLELNAKEKKQYLKIKESRNKKALQLAINEGHLEIVRYLNDNEKIALEKDTISSLLCASATCHDLAMFQYVLLNYVESYNIENVLNTYNSDALTPAERVLSAGCVEIIKWLVDKDYLSISREIMLLGSPTNFFLAACIHSPNVKIIEWLVAEKKRQISIKNTFAIFCKADSDLACVRPSVFSFLLDKEPYLLFSHGYELLYFALQTLESCITKNYQMRITTCKANIRILLENGVGFINNPNEDFFDDFINYFKIVNTENVFFIGMPWLKCEGAIYNFTELCYAISDGYLTMSQLMKWKRMVSYCLKSSKQSRELPQIYMLLNTIGNIMTWNSELDCQESYFVAKPDILCFIMQAQRLLQDCLPIDILTRILSFMMDVPYSVANDLRQSIPYKILPESFFKDGSRKPASTKEPPKLLKLN